MQIGAEYSNNGLGGIPITLVYKRLSSQLRQVNAGLRSNDAHEDGVGYDTTFIAEPMEDAMIYHVHNMEIDGLDTRLVAVDGSSRKLSSPKFKVFITGVAVYGIKPPILHYPQPRLMAKKEFLGVKQSAEILRKIEKDEVLGQYVKVKFEGSNDYFDETKRDESISNDVRQGLENWVVEELAKKLRSGYSIILDGPLYLDVQRINYIEQLTKGRIESLNKLEGQGVPVIGVVKRLETSKRLCNKDTISALSEIANVKLDVDLNYCNDALIIQEIGEKVARGAANVVLIGPLKQVYGKRASKDIRSYALPERVFWFVYSGLGSKAIRIETLGSMYANNKLKDTVETLVFWLAHTIVLGKGVPKIIDIVDHYAKDLTKRMYASLGRIMKAMSIPLDYDTELELLRIMSDLARGGPDEYV